MKLNNKIFIIAILFSLLICESKNSPIIDSKKYRLTPDQNRKLQQAKSLNRNGLINEATDIYFNLFNENPYLKEALTPLKKILKKQNNLELLTEISNIYLKRFNNNFKARIEIIDILICKNHPEWEKTIYDITKTNNINDRQIKTTLKILLDNNKNNQTIELLNSLRTKKSKDFYSYEMGTYYALNFSVEESIKEFLLHLNFNPKKYYVVRNRILAFPDIEQLNNRIQILLENDKSNLSKLILSDIKFREKKFTESYELLKKYSDNDENILDFAENLIENKQYDLSQIVINNILDNSLNDLVIQKAIIILAELFEKMVKSEKYDLPLSNSINKSQLLESPFKKVSPDKMYLLQSAIDIYDSLRINIKDLKSTYHLAEIKYRILGDLDGANKLYYEIIKNKNSDSTYKTNSIIKIVDILITKGDLDLAQETLEKFENEINAKDLHTTKTMQILFYLNKWDELEKYSTTYLKKNIKDNKFYYDILKITNNILLFENDKDNLNKYSKSLLKLFQNKRMESIEILNSISKNENSEVINKINYELSTIYLKQGKTDKAIDILDKIDIDSAYIESALLLKAEIYDYILNDKSKAVDIYLFILDEFPDSIHYEPIRLRLRGLTS